MSFTLPEKYSVLLQKVLQATPHAQLLFSQNWNSEIQSVGDVVKVPFIGKIKPQKHTTAGEALSIQDAKNGYTDVAINQFYGIPVKVPKFVAESTDINLNPVYVERMGQAFSDMIDAYLISLSSQVARPNIIGSAASPVEVDKDNAVEVTSDLISTIRSRGTTSKINVIVPSLIAKSFPASSVVATAQPEIQAMGIEKGFSINGAFVIESPTATIYSENTTISGDVLNGALSDSATSFLVDSAAYIEDDYILKIDDELMYVTDVTSKTVTVIRGFANTYPEAHDNDSEITVMKESPIIFGADPESFGAYVQKLQRIEFINQIAGQDASVIQSFLYFGAKVLNGLAGGLAYVKKKTS